MTDMEEATKSAGKEFKALFAAALVIAEARKRAQMRELREQEREARERQQEAERRGQGAEALSRDGIPAPWARPAAEQTVDLTKDLTDPVTLAEEWARANTDGAGPGVQDDLDARVRDVGVDPDLVRHEAATMTGADQPTEAAQRSETEADQNVATGEALAEQRTEAGTAAHPGVWQDGNDAARLAGQGYTATPGTNLQPGTTKQQAPTPNRAPSRTRGLGR